MRRILSILGSAVLSLILAFIVWAGAISEEDPAVTRTLTQVPLEVRNQPAGTVITTQLVQSVQVRITAPQREMDSVGVDDFIAYVDLSGVPVGQATEVPVIVQVLKRAVVLRAHTPSSLTVRLEPYAEREVPVQVVIVDTPPLGFVVGEVVADPDKVLVGGPAAAVARASYATVDVWLRGSHENVERTLSPTVCDERGSTLTNVTVSPPTINVVVEIAQRTNFKSVPIRVAWTGNPAPLYSVSNITVKPDRVTLVGPPSVLEKIPGTLETEAIDITGATETISKRVPLKLPEGVSVVPETASSSSSQMVEVTIEVVPVTGGHTVLQVPIRSQGLAPGYRATLSPQTMDVILFGPLVQLQKLTAEDIEITVNLVDLEPGTYSLTPAVIVPEGAQVTGLVPETIEVKIAGPTPTPAPTPTLRTAATSPTPSKQVTTTSDGG